MKKKNHILALEDYADSMSYKEIAEKYCVSVNTVKSWHRRYNWAWEILQNNENGAGKSEEIAHKKGNSSKNERTRRLIEASLRKQLEENGVTQAHYGDLINDYMSLWDVKNRLIEDIKERGVTVIVRNGRQENKKKNDSVTELNKTNAQMLKLLSELGLDASKVEKKDGDVGDDV